MRGAKQHTSILDGFVGQSRPAEHVGNLGHTFVVRKRLDVCGRAEFVVLLVDAEVVVGHSCYLWQMAD